VPKVAQQNTYQELSDLLKVAAQRTPIRNWNYVL
jgi:hypothetical protein